MANEVIKIEQLQRFKNKYDEQVSTQLAKKQDQVYLPENT